MWLLQRAGSQSSGMADWHVPPKTRAKTGRMSLHRRIASGSRMTEPAPHLKGFISIIAAEVARQIQAEERAAIVKRAAGPANERPKVEQECQERA